MWSTHLVFIWPTGPFATANHSLTLEMFCCLNFSNAWLFFPLRCHFLWLLFSLPTGYFSSGIMGGGCATGWHGKLHYNCFLLFLVTDDEIGLQITVKICLHVHLQGLFVSLIFQNFTIQLKWWHHSITIWLSESLKKPPSFVILTPHTSPVPFSL